MDRFCLDDAIHTADAVATGQRIVAGIGPREGQPSQGVALPRARIFTVKATARGDHIDHGIGDQAGV